LHCLRFGSFSTQRDHGFEAIVMALDLLKTSRDCIYRTNLAITNGVS
jgi:hypothetical protein